MTTPMDEAAVCGQLLTNMVQQFSRRSEELRVLCLMRDDGTGNVGNNELHIAMRKIADEMSSMEMLIEQIREYILQEKEKVDQMTELKSLILRQQKQIEYVTNNIPGILPTQRTAAPENTENIPRNVNVQPQHVMSEMPSLKSRQSRVSKQVMSSISSVGATSQSSGAPANLTKATANMSSNTQAPSQPATGQALSQSVPQLEILTMSEFEQVPQYMRGRLSFEKTNASIEALNEIIAYKYALLLKNTRELSTEQLDLISKYEQQSRQVPAHELQNRFFISETDFKLTGLGFSWKYDSGSKSVLFILRHVKRLQELRAGNAVRIFVVL